MVIRQEKKGRRSCNKEWWAAQRMLEIGKLLVWTVRSRVFDMKWTEIIDRGKINGLEG
jgi:hypothetical protein